MRARACVCVQATSLTRIYRGPCPQRSVRFYLDDEDVEYVTFLHVILVDVDVDHGRRKFMVTFRQDMAKVIRAVTSMHGPGHLVYDGRVVAETDSALSLKINDPFTVHRMRWIRSMQQ